jgi:hypothetical protein
MGSSDVMTATPITAGHFTQIKRSDTSFLQNVLLRERFNVNITPAAAAAAA